MRIPPCPHSEAQTSEGIKAGEDKDVLGLEAKTASGGGPCGPEDLRLEGIAARWRAGGGEGLTGITQFDSSPPGL